MYPSGTKRREQIVGSGEEEKVRCFVMKNYFFCLSFSSCFENLSSTRSISRGKSDASRTLVSSNNFIVRRSSPKENPPSGGMPYLNAIKYIPKFLGSTPFSFILSTRTEYW